MAGPDDLFHRLRLLAVKDPQEARKVFLASFEGDSAELGDFLTSLSNPNEGRLRQIVANAVRTHPHKGRILDVLLRWRQSEIDEFTRRAIEGALADVDTSGRETALEQQIAPSQLGDVYRYVTGRLKHRLRHAMLSAQSQAEQLKKLVTPDLGGDIQTAVAKLNDAMKSMGRELEATDVDPEHFRERSIGLAEWLRQMNLRYATVYAPISLCLKNAEDESVRVFASDYLLGTIFWNIWVNADQAVQQNCEITIEFRMKTREVELLISDNGEGFPLGAKDLAFRQQYSTKNASRGRGMLEIQDAVERLRGSIELYEARPSEYRLRLCLLRDTK